MAISAWTRRNWALHGHAPRTSFKSDPSDVPTGKLGTSDSRTMTQIANIASELGAQGAPVDLAKVAQFRQALALGLYQLSPERIAAAMLDFSGEPD